MALALFVATIFVVLGASHLFRGVDLGTLLVFLIASIVVLLVAAVVAGVSSELAIASREDLALLDDSEGDLLVEVEILSNNQLVARDRGALGFADGTLFFSGHYCSFLVGSQDLAEDHTLEFPNPFVSFIALRHDGCKPVLRFSLPRGGPRSRMNRMWQLSDAIHALRRSAPTQEERRYPPLEPPA
jgi:hypothetical protein